MDGVIVTPLKQIHHPKGDIYHGMKQSDIGFDGFGEAYFSTINKNEIKGWKKHTQMTLNIIVPVGEIKFVIYDEDSKVFFTITLSQSNYQRLTIKPDLWVSFQGLEKYNLLLNVASVEHDPDESINIALSEIACKWDMK